MDREQIEQHVRTAVAEFGDIPPADISANTELVGPNAVIKSRALVSILLDLEDFAEEKLSAEFDWSSDSAMSQSRSMFRTVGTLVDHLDGLRGEAA